MSEISREYIEQKFGDLTRRIDEWMDAYRQDIQNNRLDKAQLFERVNLHSQELGILKKDLETAKDARPTYKEMLAASFLVATFIIGLFELIIRLVS